MFHKPCQPNGNILMVKDFLGQASAFTLSICLSICNPFLSDVFFGLTGFLLLHFDAWLHIICDWDFKISEQACVKCASHMMNLCKTSIFLPESKNHKKFSR